MLADNIASYFFFLETGFTFTSISPPVQSAQAAPRIMPPAFILFSSVSICFNLFEYVPIMSDDVINSKHGEILDTAQGPTYHKHPVELTAC